MSNSHQLVEHVGGGMAARYYVDGRRVSRAAYREIKARPKRVDTFTTKARYVGTATRRTNYMIVYL